MYPQGTQFPWGATTMSAVGVVLVFRLTVVTNFIYPGVMLAEANDPSDTHVFQKSEKMIRITVSL
jgi:hypothetical protein